MAIMISRRVLEPGDFPVWKKRFEDAAPLRKAAGCQGVQRFRNLDNADEVVVIMKWDPADNCRKFVGARLKDASNQPESLFVEEIDCLES